MRARFVTSPAPPVGEWTILPDSLACTELKSLPAHVIARYQRGCRFYNRTTAIGLLIVSVATIVWMDEQWSAITLHRRARELQSWVPVTAVVSASEFASLPARGSGSDGIRRWILGREPYRSRASIHYRFADQDYQVSWNQSFPKFEQAQLWLDEWPAGKQTTIHVDPGQPGRITVAKIPRLAALSSNLRQLTTVAIASAGLWLVMISYLGLKLTRRSLLRRERARLGWHA